MLSVNEGINAAAGTIEKCFVSNCLDCKANYQVCVQCNTGTGYYLQGAVCKNQGMLAANEGINTLAGTIVACSTSNCLDCKANYQICVQCNTGVGYYLHGTVCKNLAMLTVNEGINSAAGTIVACSTSNCLDCKANYQVCGACNTGSGFYLQGTLCKDQSMLGANEGINVLTGTIDPCSASNCLDCKADYQTCIQCDTTQDYYLLATACKNQAMLKANQGIHQAAGTVVACSSSNCLDCKANYQSCIQCDVSSGYYPDGPLCQTLQNVRPGFGLNVTSQRIEPCGVECANCKPENNQIRSLDSHTQQKQSIIVHFLFSGVFGWTH